MVSVAGAVASPNQEVLVAAATGAAATASGSAKGLRSTLRIFGRPPSNPAAITVMRTSSPRVSSIVVP